MSAIVRRTGGAVALAAAMVALAASGAQAYGAAGSVPTATVLTPAAGPDVADGEITLAGPAGHLAFPTGEFVNLTLDVINTSGATCGLATEPLGTLRVLSLRRDGEDVIPLLGASYYPNRITSAIAASLTAADPGSAISVHVHQTRLDDRIMLRSVVPSAGGGLDTLWPVSEPGRYELTVAYAVPPVDVEMTRCTGAAATTVTFTVGAVPTGAAGWPWWVVVVVAALLLGAVVVVVSLVRRRRRGQPKAGSAVATIVVLLGAATAMVVPGRPAQAYIEIDPNGSLETYGNLDFRSAVEGCLARFRAPGGDPANLLPRLEDPNSPRVRIIPTYGGSNTFHTFRSPYGLGSTEITWNPVNVDDYEPGVPRDPCASLYHELAHAYGYSTGTIAAGYCGGDLRTEEVRATIIENLYRASQGLPQRTRYQRHPLPRHWSDCDAIDAAGPRTDSGQQVFCENDVHCGRTSGDPHLATFDRHYYDFQAVGEFVLVRATSGAALQVQVRQAPFGRYRTVSVNSAVAMQVADRTVAMLLVDGVSRVFLDGEVAALPAGETPLSGGARIVRRVSDIGTADGYDVIWPDGSAVRVDHDGYGYRVLVRLDDRRAGAVEGLLGNFDGDPTNDLVSASGEPLDLPIAFTDLYPSYADSWRVTAETSLFPYADGESTETFTDRDYPAASASVADLDEAARAQAEQVCRFAGITEPWLFAECVLDVVEADGEYGVAIDGRSGDKGRAMVRVYVSRDTDGSIEPNGDAVTAVLDQPGSMARFTFTGTAGQRVFVAATAGTLPNQCSPLRLEDASGARLGHACLAGGRGHIDGTVLPADGTYTVVVDPADQAIGTVTLHLHVSDDSVAAIALDGPAVTATVDTPGAVRQYEFSAAAGTSVTVVARDGTLPDSCPPLRLVDATGRTLGSSCLSGGGGTIGPVVLPADGTYRVVVDPLGASIGEVTLSLSSR